MCKKRAITLRARTEAIGRREGAFVGAAERRRGEDSRARISPDAEQSRCRGIVPLELVRINASPNGLQRLTAQNVRW